VQGHGIHESWQAAYEGNLAQESEQQESDMAAAKEHIRQLIGQRIDSIYECYQYGLLVWNSEGRIRLKFIVATDGRVVRVKVASNTMPREIACCVQNRVRSWTFAPWQQSEIALIEYPFVFEVEHAPPPS